MPSPRTTARRIDADRRRIESAATTAADAMLGRGGKASDLSPLLADHAWTANVAGRKRTAAAARKATKLTVPSTLTKPDTTTAKAATTDYAKQAAPYADRLPETDGKPDPAAVRQLAEFMVASGYADGQGAVLTHPDVAAHLSAYTYHAIDDDKTRPLHAALDGMTRPVDDPVWKSVKPPVWTHDGKPQYGCRCWRVPRFGKVAMTNVPAELHGTAVVAADGGFNADQPRDTDGRWTATGGGDRQATLDTHRDAFRAAKSDKASAKAAGDKEAAKGHGKTAERHRRAAEELAGRFLPDGQTTVGGHTLPTRKGNVMTDEDEGYRKVGPNAVAFTHDTGKGKKVHVLAQTRDRPSSDGSYVDRLYVVDRHGKPINTYGDATGHADEEGIKDLADHYADLASTHKHRDMGRFKFDLTPTSRLTDHARITFDGDAVPKPQLVLSLSAAAPLTEPTESDLTGLPRVDAAGHPIHWRWWHVALAGDWTHRGTGQPVPIPESRLDEWVTNTAIMHESGVRPYATVAHTTHGNTFRDPDARDTLGMIERTKRQGGELWTLTGFHGDENLAVAARNSCSVGVMAKQMRDAYGKVRMGEYLHHVAAVPNPALPGVGTMRVAASAAVDETDVPVLVRADPVAKAIEMERNAPAPFVALSATEYANNVRVAERVRLALMASCSAH